MDKFSSSSTPLTINKTVAFSSTIVNMGSELGRYIGFFDGNFYDEALVRHFVIQIDALIEEGQSLKNDNSCSVSRIRWNNRNIVVKRYNHQGLIHSLRHTIKGSRARRSWHNANLLMKLSIATPKPLAYIEHRKRFLVWKSYFVAEYIEGQRLQDFLRDSILTEENRVTVTQQVDKLLDALRKHRITHGDLKHTNILVSNEGPVLTDLDGMQVHRLNWIFRCRRARDLARFAQ